MKTDFDMNTDKMKNYWYKKCRWLLKKVDKLSKEADELSEKADEYLSDGNELEWEDCLKQSIESQAFADGIVFALKKLGFYNDEC